MNNYFLKKLIRNNYFPQNISKKLICKNKFSLDEKVFNSRKLIPAKNTSFKMYNSLEFDA